jgi:hypothetical protein
MSSNQKSVDRDTDPAPRGPRGWWSLLVGRPGPASVALCLVGAALLVVSSVIHLHLWSTGYRHIPTIGPLFLLQGVAGIALALVISVSRRPWAALAGALFAASTIGGLLVSVEVGLFGFKDSLSAPDATSSLVVESAALVVLAVAVLLGAHRPRDVAVGALAARSVAVHDG